MLKRVLEPEVMNTPEEALAYDAMDHSEVNRQFVADLLSLGPLEGEVLDLGTGTAQIPIELCRQCPTVRVMAVDLGEGMLDLARANVEAAGLTERILLDLVDAKRLSLADDRFAGVISNSLVHHLSEPAFALAEAVRVTAPGGRIFFRDLLRPPDDTAVKRLVHQYTGRETEAQQAMFDASLRAALTLHEIRDLVRALGFDPLSVRTTSDRHWTWAASIPTRIAQ